MAVRARVPARITFEAAFLALLGVAFPVLFGITVVVAGVALIVLLGHFLLFLAKLVWVLVFPLFAALRSLWRALPGEQHGEPLVAEQCPELFATIERLRAAADGGRIHAVYLTANLNAGMAQRPRYGIFGGFRNELLLGLPLMAAMDETHYTAVLAHEIGHLARRHGRFSARIYGMRQTLDVIVEDLARGGSWLVYPMLWFYQVFAPRFERVTLQLSRAVEYEADAEAADAVGRQAAAESLIVLHGISSYSDAEVWPEIFRRVNDDPEPPDDVFASFSEIVRRPIADAHRFVSEALGMQTSASDTHPALLDRLRNLGFAPGEVEHALDGYALHGPSAADLFLAGAGAQRRAIATAWRSAVRPQWVDAHADAAKVRAELVQLDALGDAADPGQRRTRALAAARLARPDAVDLLLAVAESSSDDPEPALLAGEMLAARADERAIGLLERAISADPFATVRAAGAAAAFYSRRGDFQRATAYRERLHAWYAELQRAAEERRTFAGTEPIEPHGLAADDLAIVRRALDLPDIEGAYLARRRLAHVAVRPHFVLGVLRRKTKQGSSDDNIAGVISSELDAAFRYGISVIVSTRATQPAIVALRNLEGSEITP